MKQKWNSFLQTVFQFVRSLRENVAKRVHRDAVLMTAGISVMMLLTLTAGDLQGSGRNTMVAFAETPAQSESAETELEEIELEETELKETDSTEFELEADKEDLEEELEETGEAFEIGAVEADETETDEAETDEAETNEEKKAESEYINHIGYDSLPEETSDDENEVVNLSDSEYNVLLRIVQAEAGGCDEEGKVLVANVILNRMESDEFPDTVSGVVYQRNQFSPVSNGSINTCKVSEETIEAVERALNGEDNSEGALYFMNRGRSASRNVRWFDANLDFLFKHGDHEFFK